ncbi:MAG: hypothetical protein JWO75_6619, partial [Actinomycetia bacterium]|nr:hypothetical protein [Actinomycetes bacterium]
MRNGAGKTTLVRILATLLPRRGATELIRYFTRALARDTTPWTHDVWAGHLVEAAAVAGVDRVRVKAEEGGELFHDDVEDQLGELGIAVRPGHQR